MAEKSDNTDRRRRILDAASRLIIRFGFDKTTVDDIAREAGVSKGAIYLHFDSKEALFEALIRRETDQYIADWLAAVEADPEGGKLPNMYSHGIAILLARPLMHALYSGNLSILGAYVRRRDPHYPRARFLLGMDFIRMMQAAGLVRQDIDADLISYTFASLSLGLLTIGERIPPEMAPPIEKVLSVIRDILAYIVPQDGGDSEAGKRILAELIAAYKERNL